MFRPEDLPSIREAIRERALADSRLLDDLRADARRLAASVRPIRPRSTTAVSLVASDGGNNKLVFDPFYFQVVRVVDSFGEQLCLEVVSPTTDTDLLSRRQFDEAGRPQTALGRLMADLGVDPPLLCSLSPMIPSGREVRERPNEVSPSWVQVYRDLSEWAQLYDLVCRRDFGTDTLLVRDGILRSKVFAGEYFVKMRRRMEEAIARIYERSRRRVFLVGVAKSSQVLTRYQLAMAIEGTFPGGEPRYVRVPREIEAKAYRWPEYARGAETEGQEGEVAKFVAGDMYFVRFGVHTGDPIWVVDILSSQSAAADEIFGYLLADAIDGFPVPLYPRCLQRAHEHAQIVDFDLAILQDQVYEAIRQILPDRQKLLVDSFRLNEDVAGRRYG